MTHRSASRWLACAAASTLLSVLAIVGLPLYAQESPAEVTTLPAMTGAAEPVPVALSSPTDEASPAELSGAAPVGIAAPEAAPEEAAAEAPGPPPPPSPCADAMAWVGEAGLPLPAGVGYHCPSTRFPHHGAACWNNGSYCPGSGFIAINMDLLQGTSTDYLRHVVAHEVCHILEFQAAGRTTEASADACAAAHGAP